MEFELFISFSGSLSEDYLVLSLLGRPIFPRCYCPLVGVIVCFSWKFSGLQVALCLAVRSTACLTSLAGRGQRSEHTDVLGCFICASPSSAFIQLETLWLCPRITVQIPVKRLVAIKDFIIFFCQDLRAANTNSEGNFAFSGDSLACPFHKGVVSQPDGAGAAQLPKLDVPRSLRFSAHHFRAQNRVWGLGVMVSSAPPRPSTTGASGRFSA